MPVHTYTNWNSRPSEHEEQVEPYRKYFFICEGANTETFYFRRLIDLRKQLGIHPLIDIRLWEKTEGDKYISFPKNLLAFAESQKKDKANSFDVERDKMVVVFDGDIFEDKVKGYDKLIAAIEEHDIAAVTNPSFELFLILHYEGSYEKHIKGHEEEFFQKLDREKHGHAYSVLLELSGMNAKSNSEIGKLADQVFIAIEQEKKVNQDLRMLKGRISSNVGYVIESIINEKPDI